MNQRLAAAIEGIQHLSEARQADVADILETVLAQEAPEPEWTAEQLAQIEASVAEADRGEFISEAEVARLFPRRSR